MKVIYKYELLSNIGGTQIIDLPFEAQILKVDMRPEGAVMWALVDPERVVEPRTFTILGTGHPTDLLDGDSYVYLGTFYEQDILVWHVFEVLHKEVQ